MDRAGQPAPREEPHGLSAVRDAQFAAGVLDMLVDRFRRLAGQLGDFFGLEALADQGQAFSFARREASLHVRRELRRHGSAALGTCGLAEQYQARNIALCPHAGADFNVDGIESLCHKHRLQAAAWLGERLTICGHACRRGCAHVALGLRRSWSFGRFGGLVEVGSGPDDAASRSSVFASVRFVMTGRCPVERILSQGCSGSRLMSR